MKNLFDVARVDEVKGRLVQLRPESERQWGSMDVGQMVAHCSAGLEMSLGDTLPPRLFLGRVLGWIIKPLALRNDDPMRKNSPTMPEIVVSDKRDLDVERSRLLGLIDRFVAVGRAECTAHPHSFFGRLLPEEWAVLMYKHLDHHLRQFGV